MCDHRHYHQHQLRHRHCDNGEVLMKGLLVVIIFASLRGKSSSLEAKLFFFFFYKIKRIMSLIFHVYLISFLNNLPIVFNMIHGRVQFSTSALSVCRKNSIHVLFSPNVAWHWSSWPSGRRGGSRYILHWRCSQPEGDKVQYRILHEPGEWTGESWHSHTLHQGKILITDGSVGWVSFIHAGGRGFGLKLK